MAATKTPSPQTARSELERRVLVATPTGRDAEVLCELLAAADIDAATVDTLEQLCREIDNGAAAAILAEEFVTTSSRHVLTETLSRQPEWSDFPIILMTAAGRSRDPRWQLFEDAGGTVHPVLLERPVRRATLLSSVRAALLSRQRQYQVRQELRRRRRAERELRESEEQRSVALAAGRMGTWVWDLKSDTVAGDTMHRALWDIDGNNGPVPSSLIIGRVHPDDVSRMYSKEQLAEYAGPFDTEFRIIRRNGDVRWLKASAMPLLDENGLANRLIGVDFDITERKQYEQRLLEADKHKDDFIAILAHELRNPLAPIRNATQVFDLVDLGDKTLAEMRDVIKRQVHHMARLLDDLLDVSRIGHGKIALKRQQVDLCEVVRTTSEDWRSEFDERRVDLVVRIPGEPIPVYVDSTRISQCIGNLLNNSLKFTDQGGRVQLELTCRQEGAILTVSDDGVGMDPEFVEHLYEPFRQADRSLHRSPGGLGLGLAMVKGLVELHGGHVDARSEGVGEGSEFVIHLPLETRLP